MGVQLRTCSLRNNLTYERIVFIIIQWNLQLTVTEGTINNDRYLEVAVL